MLKGSIARRYARALLEVAAADFENVGAELAGLHAALVGSPELAAVFRNPSIGRSSRDGVIEELIKSAALSLWTANFLRVLNDRNRVESLPAIAKAYAELSDQKAGRIRAKLTGAITVPAEFAAKVQATLAAATKKTVAVETAVDPKLLGGVVAQVGHTVYDASLKTQLEALRRELEPR